MPPLFSITGSKVLFLVLLLSAVPGQDTEEEGRFVRLLASMEAREEPARKAIFEKITTAGTKLGPATLEALVRAHDRWTERLRINLGPATLKALRAQLLKTCETRRKSAMDLIFDEKRYPYPPSVSDGRKVQEEVNGLVRRVEEAYHPGPNAMTHLRDQKAFDTHLDAIVELESYLGRCNQSPEAAKSLKRILEKTVGSIDLCREAEAVKSNADVLAENVKVSRKMIASGTMDEEEAVCILATNRYRIMMGVPPMPIQAEHLQKAARAHAADMVKRGYFSHVDPEGVTHQDRAKAAGYSLEAGENITMGDDGVSAFRSWTQSSGHHRSGLKDHWKVVAIGRNGRTWVRMYGVGRL